MMHLATSAKDEKSLQMSRKTAEMMVRASGINDEDAIESAAMVLFYGFKLLCSAGDKFASALFKSGYETMVFMGKTGDDQ